jgi:oxygen-dependent protoporphyrinogen oxidase
LILCAVSEILYIGYDTHKQTSAINFLDQIMFSDSSTPTGNATTAPLPLGSTIAIVGAGITGLSAAYYLQQQRPDLNITLLESTDKPGGILQTIERDDFLVELGPDMFTTRDDEAVDLCRELGMENQLISTNTEHRGAYIICRDKLCKMPLGWTMMTPTRLGAILKTPLLSWKGKLRVIAELFILRKKSDGDESLASFTRRRLGPEALERIIQPLISGIYTADPEKLSMQATLADFLAMERTGKGLIREGIKQRRSQASQESSTGARYGAFVAPKYGMQSIITALTDQLKPNTLKLRQRVKQLEFKNNAWQLTIAQDTQRTTTHQFDRLLLTTSSQITGRLLQDTCPELSKLIVNIPLAGAAIVTMGYRFCDIEHPLDAFGVVVPQAENRPLIAISMASQKFTGRAPHDSTLFRIFAGGALQPELLQWDDEQLIESAKKQLRELLGVNGKPIFTQVVRWDNKMPQYHVGHVELVDKIELALSKTPNLEIAGNAYRGVGIPLCIRNAKSAVKRLIG